MENAWLIRYLDRQLSEEELAAFEAYVLDKPEMLAQIDADTALRDALVEAGGTGLRDAPGEQGAHEVAELLDTAGIAAAAAPATKAPGVRRRRRWPIVSSLWFALLGSLLVGLAAGSAGEHLLAHGQVAQLIASPTRLIFDTANDSLGMPRLEYGESSSQYVLVEIAVPRQARRITLQISDRPAQALTGSLSGFVTALIDKRTLNAARQMHVSYEVDGVAQQRWLPLSPFALSEI